MLLALLLAGCRDKTSEFNGYVADSQQASKQGDTRKARLNLQNALRIKPADPAANLALAKIEDADDDLNAAIPYYLRAAAPDARLLEAQLRVIEILIDLDRLQDALGRINLTLGAFPGNAAVLALKADIEQRQGLSEQARTDSNEVLLRDPFNARALAVAALLRLEAKDSDRALALVEKGLSRSPEDLDLLRVKAAILVTTDKPEQAVAAFKTITRTAPRNVIAQQVLADLQVKAGHPEDALQGLQQAVAQDPANQPLQLLLVRFLASQKKDADAISYLNELIKNNPKGDGYDLVLAEYYRSNGDFVKSEDVLRRAADRLGDTAIGLQVQVAIAKVEATAGRLAAASDLLNKIIEKDPKNASALLVRANLLLQAGRASEAVRDLLVIVGADPVNQQAFETLAAAYRMQGQAKLAIDAMQRSVAVSPGDDAAQLRLASFLQQGGSMEAARDIMARLTLRRPSSVQIWAADARLALDRKDWAAADRSARHLRGLPDGAVEAQQIDTQLKIARGNGQAAVAGLRQQIENGNDVTPQDIGNFAVASASAGDTANAITVLQNTVGRLKGDALQSAWLALMSLNAVAEQPDRVEAAYRQAIAIAPQSPNPYLSYVAYLKTKNAFAKAQGVIDEGLRQGAPKLPLLLFQGSLQEQQADMAGALASYKDALAASPYSADAANNYASILADLRPKDIPALTEARSRIDGLENGANPLFVDTAAWLDYRLGRVEEARTLLTRIKAGESDNPQLRFHMAAVLLASGDKPGGLALLETVKNLTFPGSDEVRRLSDS